MKLRKNIELIKLIFLTNLMLILIITNIIYANNDDENNIIWETNEVVEISDNERVIFRKKEIGHGGGWPGVHTLMRFRPEDNTAVILFTNSMSPTFQITILEHLAFKIMFKSFFMKARNL